MPEREAFQEDQRFVLEELLKGEIDHVEVVSRVIETEFFRQFIGSGDITRLADAYPTPRKKQEVPLWIYLSTQITLRLHGAPGFSSLPYILHCGGLRDALEQGQLERKVGEDTGRSYLSFKGYNEKNSYDRRTPCDQDFVRKLARDTCPSRLESWFGGDVARYFHDAGAFDEEGIFMVDGSYLFIPDNPRYELSKSAYFDEHNHPVSREEEKKLTAAQRKRCRFRRYYQTVALSHTNRSSDFLLYAGARVLRSGGEVNQLRPLISDFVEAVGEGVLKTLLIDRGFIDGESLGGIKSDLGVDWIVPLKAGMDITTDAWKLAEVDKTPWVTWQPPPKVPPPEPPQRPEGIRKAEKKRQATVAAKKKEREEKEGSAARPELVRVELKVIPGMRLWSSCSVPVNVVLMREHMSDGTCSRWGLMTSREVDDPLEIRRLYAVRSACEEGWRQEKCYWDLTGFRAASFSLVVNQVIFVLMAYSLLQLFLIKSDRGELAKATRQRLLAELLPDGEKVAVYRKNRVGYFRLMDYSQILLELSEGARRRLVGTIRRLRKSQLEPPELPQRPTL